MNESEFKICVLYCYMGEFPWYFPFFIKSCQYNPSIDFYIITDQPAFVTNAKNIYFIKKNLQEIDKLATKQLGFKTAINNYYKLCDFKPTYGAIFMDITSNYDFWSFGDIDVIFGNIRNFFTDELLKVYDVISTREKYISGFFALFKNSPKTNKLFEQSKDYKFVLSNSKHFCFDECNFEFIRLKEGKQISEIKSEVESMTHVVKKMEANGEIKAFFDHLVVEDVPGNLEWKEGALFYNNKYEALLYHLINFKTHPYLIIPDWVSIPNNFFINEFSFSEYSPTSAEGKKIIEDNNTLRANLVAEKIRRYANINPLKLNKDDQNDIQNYCGIYKPLSNSDTNNFYLKLSNVNDELEIEFSDNFRSLLLRVEKNLYLLSAPMFNAEVKFRFDPFQLTQSISILPIGSHKKIELHKI